MRVFSMFKGGTYGNGSPITTGPKGSGGSGRSQSGQTGSGKGK